MTETRPILCLCVRRPEQDPNHNLLDFAGKGPFASLLVKGTSHKWKPIV